MNEKSEARKALIESGILDGMSELGKDKLKEMLLSAYVDIAVLNLELERAKSPKIIMPH